MEQKFNLTINKPCSEKFEQFKKTTNGGFCSSCCKEVIDFRAMTNEQLITFFKDKKSSTCGYFNTHQLETFIPGVETSKTNNYKFLRIVALAFLSLTSLHYVQAQDKKPQMEIVQKYKNLEHRQNSNIRTQEKLLSGTIFDESGPLPNANILLKGTNIGTTTNFDGEFKFPKVLEEGAILIVSYIGYETQKIKVEKNQTTLHTVMKGDSCILMGEVEVNEVYKSKRTLWQSIKDIF